MISINQRPSLSQARSPWRSLPTMGTDLCPILGCECLDSSHKNIKKVGERWKGVAIMVRRGFQVSQGCQKALILSICNTQSGIDLVNKFKSPPSSSVFLPMTAPKSANEGSVRDSKPLPKEPPQSSPLMAMEQTNVETHGIGIHPTLLGSCSRTAPINVHIFEWNSTLRISSCFLLQLTISANTARLAWCRADGNRKSWVQVRFSTRVNP